MTVGGNQTERKYSYRSAKPETLANLLRGFDVSYSEWMHHLLPRFGSSILIKLYSLTQVNATIDPSQPYTGHDYFISCFIDDVPIPFKHSECVFDGDRYRCNWELVSAFFTQHSIGKGVDLDQVCFSHLEGRVRTEIVETNMPWWLAFIIAAPMVVGSVMGIKWELRRRQRKREQAESYKGIPEGEEFKNI
jgi:hypothetical protein